MSIQPHSPTELSLMRTIDDQKTQPDARVTFTLLPDDRNPPRYTVGSNKEFTLTVKNNDFIITPTYFQGTIKQFIPEPTPTPSFAIEDIVAYPTPLPSPKPTPTTVRPTPRPTATPFVPPQTNLDRPPPKDKKKFGPIDWLPIPLPTQLTLNLWIAIALFPALLLALYLLARRARSIIRNWRIRRSLRRRAAQAAQQANPPPDA